MLFYNLNYRWKDQVDEGKHIPAVILHPSGIDRPSCIRRVLKEVVTFDRLLMDPQLYLLNLRFRPGVRPKDAVIKRLHSYPWFGIGPEDLAADGLHQHVEGGKPLTPAELWDGRKDILGTHWPNIVAGAIGYQLELECDQLVLPATLIEDPSSTLDEETDRLQEAFAATQAINRTSLPVYASLPLADLLFLHDPQEADRLIDSLVDLVSAQDGLTGVYIPFIQQSSDAGDRIAQDRCVRAILRLAWLFGHHTKLKVIFNFVESLGIVCSAFGAEGYATGPSKAQRRCTPMEFCDGGGPGASPKFFSLELCTDFRPEPEMEWIRDIDSLDLIAKDRTVASEALFLALERGMPVAGNAPDWDRNQPITLQPTRHHYFALQTKAVDQIQTVDQALSWLRSAERNGTYLAATCEKDLKDNPKFSIPMVHVPCWRKALAELLRDENVQHDLQRLRNSPMQHPA